MRKFRIIIFSMLALLLLVGAPLLFFNPRFQIETYIRSHAHNDHGRLAAISSHFIAPYRESHKRLPASMVRALADMLSDHDALVRRETLRFLDGTSYEGENFPQFAALPDFREKLKQLVNDRDPDTVDLALGFLAKTGDAENISFFRGVLKRYSSNERICAAAIFELGEIRDPRALDDILPFVHDGRKSVVCAALLGAAHYDDPRALNTLAEMLSSPDYNFCATRSLRYFKYTFPQRDISEQMDPALLKASGNNAVDGYRRAEIPSLIQDRSMQIQAWENLLSNPSLSNPLECQLDALEALVRMKPMPPNLISILQKLLVDPATDPKVHARAESALNNIQSGSTPVRRVPVLPAPSATP